MLRLPSPLTLFAILASLLATSTLHADLGPPPAFEFLAGTSDGEKAVDPDAVIDLRIDHALIQSDPDQLSVQLPGGRSVVAARSYWRWLSAEEFHWFGELDDAVSGSQLPGSISFHFYQNELFGTLRTADGAAYRFTPQAGIHRLVRSESSGSGCGVEHTRRPWTDHGEFQSIAAPLIGTSDSDCTPPTGDTTIDVMVLYPLSLKTQATAVQQYAVDKVMEANMIFSMSGIGIDYRLVYVGPITAEQPPPPSLSGPNHATEPVLDWLNGQFATTAVNNEVELRRMAHGADLIHIVVPQHPNDNCGIANLPELRNGAETMNNSPAPFAKKAFTVAELNCGQGDFTFAHEFGHTFGMRHEDDPLPPTGVRQPILPWAFGYDIPVPGTDVATVMACFEGPLNCRRVKHFSNPDVNYLGVPTGLHSSQSATPSHNACVANRRRAQYAGFASPRPSNPPSLVIDSPTDGAQFNEDDKFTLVATANDTEDGDLRASVRWTSDRDDFLGTGSPLTTSLSSGGDHLITAEVTDMSGTKVPYSIRLMVRETQAPRRWIARPEHNQQISGNFLVEGWATDSSGVTNISFRVDGAPVSLSGLNTNVPRADVCAVHSDLNDPDCPGVGFQGTLDTEQFSNGSHLLELIATDRWGNTTTMNRRFRKVTSKTFYTSDDAYVSEFEPNKNFGLAKQLKLRSSGSGQALHTYLKFNVSGLPGAPLSAKLRLRTGSTALGGLRVYWMKVSSWSQNTITWNTASPLFYSNFPTSPHPMNSVIEIDVLSIIQGNDTYTIGLVSPDTPNQELFSSDTFFGPELIVTY